MRIEETGTERSGQHRNGPPIYATLCQSKNRSARDYWSSLLGGKFLSIPTHRIATHPSTTCTGQRKKNKDGSLFSLLRLIRWSTLMEGCFFFTNKLAKKAALKGGKNSMLNYIEFCGEGFGRDVISADSSKIPLFTIPLFFVYFFQSFSPDGADSTFFKRTEHTHTQKSAHF